MKPKHAIIPMLLLGAAMPCSAETEVRKQSTVTAESSATSEGNVTRKSVTVTSDGGKTIRKTVTVRDGKEEVVTEITDSNGKVTRIRKQEDERGAEQPAAGDDQGAWLGVHVGEASAALRDQLGLAKDEGVVVEAVAPDGPAAKAGLRTNDLLLSLDGAKLSDAEDLRHELRRREPGDTVSIELLRKGEKQTESVTLGKRGGASDQQGEGNRGDSTTTKIELDVQTDGNGAKGSASAVAGDSLDDLLNDPNLPENFRKTVREMKERMDEFEKKHRPE
jgi:predicted metalloprotease with PDZ domain